MENKIKATRYCLDNETERGYSEMFKQCLDNLGSGIFLHPDRLLKLVQNLPFEFKDDKCELPVEGNMFYQREEDLKNILESTLTVSGNEEPYIIERKVEFQTSVTLQQAVEKLCEELKSDEDYYRSWKDAIAMNFKDEYWRTYNKEGASKEEIEEIHSIANKAADNFLKQLIK